MSAVMLQSLGAFVFLTALVAAPSDARQLQSCNLIEVDICVSNLLVFTQRTPEQTSVETEVSKKCGYIKSSYNCLANYSRTCMTRDQQMGAKLMFSGVSRLHRQYCDNRTSFFREYKQHAVCLRKTQDGQNNCYADLRVALESVTSVDWDKRMDLSCCAYNRVRNCLRSVIKNKCGRRAVVFLRKMIRTAMSRLPDIVCASSSLKKEVCQLLPEPGTELTGERSGKPVFKLLANILPDREDEF